MKKLHASLAVSLLLVFGCAQTQVVPVPVAATPAAGLVASIKAGKEAGSIDKEFFRKILAQKPANVFIVDVRTPFEYKAGHFDGARHLYINDLYDKGCEATVAQLPKEGYVVFVCATGARAGEMYSGLLDDCRKQVDAKRLYFLDEEVAYTPTGAVIR